MPKQAKAPVSPKSAKRSQFDEAVKKLPTEVQERLLALIYALMFRRDDWADEIGEFGDVGD